MSVRLKLVKFRFTPFLMAFLFLAIQLMSSATLAILDSGMASAANEMDASSHQGQEKPAGTYTSGNVTTYTELDKINFRLNLSSSSAASGKMQVEFTSNDTGCLFFDGTFNLGTHSGGSAVTNVSGTAPVVTLDGVASNNGSDWIQVLNVSFAGSGSATLNYHLRLTDQAGDCSPGSPQHSRVAPAPNRGAFKNFGAMNVPIPSNQIIALPNIYVQKWVDTTGDGQVDRKALAGEWSFSLNGGSPVATDANGNVTFSNVTPNGNHTITELNGPVGQSFKSGSGTNCTFNGSTATANVESGTTAKDATCIFNNGVNPGSITIIKDAKPNRAQDFAFTTTGTGLSGFSLDDDTNGDLSNTKTFNNLVAGQYSVTETAVSGWDLKSIDCGQSSGITVASNKVTFNLSAGQNVVCTFTNVKRANITVNKVTDPANDPSVFPITISGSGNISGNATQNLTTANSVTYSVSEGSYSITETLPAGWAQSGNTCNVNNLTIVVTNSTTEQELSKACTITNTKLSKITFVKNAIPNSAQDFVFSTTGTGLSGFILDDDADSVRSNSVTFNDLMPGSYTAEENSISGWDMTNLECTGQGVSYQTDDNLVSVTLSAGQDITCTFTNTQRGSISGYKFEDLNNNGVWDEGEPGLSQWSIFIDSNNNGVYDDGEYLALTDENGLYYFMDLIPSNYSIFEQMQDGWTQTTAPSNPVELLPGQNLEDQNFGNFKNAELSGYKFNDFNGNSSFDEDEQKLPGWTIQLMHDNDDEDSLLNNVFDSEVTNSDGYYKFVNVPAGTYQVCEVQQAGWAQTLPLEDACYIVEITESSSVVDTLVFGNQGQASIKIKKNVDSDGDGQVDIYDATDWVWDIDGQGEYDTGFNLTKVPAGNHTISERQKEDFHFVSVSCNTEKKVVQSESFEITMSPGDQITCTYTNARDTGKIKVTKYVAPQNDSGYFDLLIDDIAYATEVQNGGTTGYVTLPTGEYQVGESAGSNTDLDDYIQQISGDCSYDGKVNVKKGDELECYINNTKKAKVTIIKQAYPYNDPQAFDFTFTEYQDECYYDDIKLLQVLNDDEYCYEAFDKYYSEEGHNFTLDDNNDEEYSDREVINGLTPGEYVVKELPVEGWDLYDIYCDYGDDYSAGSNYQEDGRYLYLEAGSEVICTFVNVKRAKLTIVKDSQPNSPQEFNFRHNIEGKYSEDFTLVDDGENTELSSKTFDNLKVGNNREWFGNYYGISEDEVDGWRLDDFSCDNWEEDYEEVPSRIGTSEYSEEWYDHYIFVGPGEHVTCTFVNQELSLNITKSNNKPAPTVVGDIVTYTLQVTVPQESSDIYDAQVIDLPPENFEYLPGTWTANSSSRGDIKVANTTTEPTYASPGEWELGNLEGGEVVTMTYQAKILSNVTPGIYPDIAFVSGFGPEEQEVLGNTKTATTPFVGTSVAVAMPSSSEFIAPTLVNTGRALAAVTLMVPMAMILLTVLAYKRTRHIPQKGAQK